jgi:hypothetical protein
LHHSPSRRRKHLVDCDLRAIQLLRLQFVMDDGRRQREYAGPRIVDYGGLAELTGMDHMVFGSAAREGGVHDLSFSGTGGGGGGGGGGTVLATTASTSTTPAHDVLPAGAEGTVPEGAISPTSATSPGSGSNPSGTVGSLSGGSSVGSGGGGGGLPFTGFAAGALAATGAVLTSAGVALRRAVRRRG